MAPLQYRCELLNLRRVPTLLRLVQQRQHRISTNRSQINTRICEPSIRMRAVERLHLQEALTVTMELTMIRITSAMAVMMVVMILPIAETTEP